MTAEGLQQPPRRARSLAELRAIGPRFLTEAGLARGLALPTRPDDVIISTFPKCGTTWLQQIVHGLRSGGSMDFDEITAVVPWMELAHDMGLDPEAPQVATPRAFKSHLSYDQVPKGARYVNAIRDPGDVLMSMYRFFDGWRLEPGCVSLEEFAFDYFLPREGGRGYWNHVLSWWRERHRTEVLLLCYEDMRDDLPGTVARVARFMDVQPDAATLEKVIHQATLPFMKAHERQFDDHLVREARDVACGLPAGGHTTKVASGTSGAAAKHLGADVIDALDEAWRTRMAPHTDLADYNEMRAALAAGR